MTVSRNLCLLAITFALNATLLSAQNITTGYAVITPEDGTPDGLLAFGSLTLSANGQNSQGIFAATPLLNAAGIPISTNTALSQDTGIAIVNPNAQSVNVSLLLRVATPGVSPLTQSFTLAGGQQTSKFVTEVFGNQAISQGAPSVLTLVASMPVGVVAFNFDGTNFSAVPVTDLTTVVGLSALATLNSDVPGSVTPNASTSTPSSTSLQMTTIAGETVQVSNTNPTTLFFPRISMLVGGNGAVILSQYATNGGWQTQVIIENPSSTARTIRVDFFDATGAPLNVQFQNGSGSSFTDINIPAFGTFVLTPQ